MYDVKQQLAQLIDLDGVEQSQIAKHIVSGEDEIKGDYSLPVFRYAKAQGLTPFELAGQIAQKISQRGIVQRAVAVGGYVNMFVDRRAVVLQSVKDMLVCDNFGNSNEGEGKTICIDYSSINIAKPFHIGHLGTTAIGNCLYRVLSALGYKCVGINHLGDWGTQFGKLIVAFKKWGSRQMIDEGGLKALQDIYVRFHVEAEQDDSLNQQARDWFAAIERGDDEATVLFEYFKKITLDEIGKLYERLDIHFDSWNGESFYNDKMEEALNLLKQREIVTLSDGALVVDLAKYDMPPCLLVKKDGASLYATRDIAAIFYRKKTYDFYKCLYVVAYQQNLHFKQLFKVIELAGLDYYADLVHVAYGMVSLEEGSMSTRKGNTVWLSDVVDKAVEKALAVIEQKNPLLQDKQAIAEQVGVGAVIFSALENAKIKDTVFSFDRVLSFEGETAPYLQYTHARCCSLLARAGEEICVDKIDADAYCDNASMMLCKLLVRFPDVLTDVGAKYEPSLLSNYLIDLAKCFNKYYIEHKIICDDQGQRMARFALVNLTGRTLKRGLYLLGISCPDRM